MFHTIVISLCSGACRSLKQMFGFKFKKATLRTYTFVHFVFFHLHYPDALFRSALIKPMKNIEPELLIQSKN